jgi:hypothetical protein
METNGKVVIVVAIIGAIATIAAAIIAQIRHPPGSSDPDTSGPTSISQMTCPPIPPVTGGDGPTRDGYVWVHGYVDWVNNDWKQTSGHWERRRADGRTQARIPGYWDTSEQRCVWILSRDQ